jgi:hypothetical protein
LNPSEFHYSAVEKKYTNGPQAGGCLILGLVLGFFLFWPLLIITPIVAAIYFFTPRFVGKCPYCGEMVEIDADKKGTDCHGCKKRIIRRGDQFEIVE